MHGHQIASYFLKIQHKIFDLLKSNGYPLWRWFPRCSQFQFILCVLRWTLGGHQIYSLLFRSREYIFRDCEGPTIRHIMKWHCRHDMKIAIPGFLSSRPDLDTKYLYGFGCLLPIYRRKNFPRSEGKHVITEEIFDFVCFYRNVDPNQYFVDYYLTANQFWISGHVCTLRL